MVGMLFAAVLVFYLLSPGPLRIYYSNRIPPSAVIAFYFPVEWAAEYVPGVRWVYRLYFRLWEPANN
jgi:hypothetical protein